MNPPQAWRVKGDGWYPKQLSTCYKKKYLKKKISTHVEKMYLCEAYLFLPEILQGFDQQITSIVYLEKKKKTHKITFKLARFRDKIHCY